ncbi:MAG: ATP synthase F1 subunit gamma [Planctomycetota bacterium]|nr:MAG: ATP synthase F1 subunit gamma [Planctomycetota bacterium]
MAKATNPRAIKRKIRSVSNLKKITKAMEMVSAAKLRRAQEALAAVRPYADQLGRLMGRLQGQASATEVDAPLLAPRTVRRRAAMVVVTADKGLCGSYNTNLLRLADRTVREIGLPVTLYTVGRKARDHFAKRGESSREHWEGLPPNVGFRQVREITTGLVSAYLQEEVDEVWVLYTEYVNAITFRPRAVRFLPFEAGSEDEGESAEGGEGGGQWIFEPDPATIFAQLIPRVIEVRFYRLLLEALASEHGARMQAMRNATDNAQELIDTLTLTFNKARQAAITKELLDIIGGAEGLKG